jgi:putative membrane protein
MLLISPGWLKQPWMHAKLGLVALLFAYHFVNQRLFARLQRNERTWHSYALRLWNEGATIILFGVVFLAVLKSVSWYVGVAGLVILGGVLMMAISAYRKRRKDAAGG